MVQYTRSQYMKGEVSHREDYGQFVDETIKNVVISRFGVEKLKLARMEDEHFNNIPLVNWDRLGESYRFYLGKAIAQANGNGGVSLSDLVCTMKEAAQQVIEEN